MTQAVTDPVVGAAVNLFGARVVWPRTPPVLREYQRHAVARLEAALEDGKRPLLVAPTGSGATASPTRKDGRALGLLYDTIVQPATTHELTAAGYLVPARSFSWPTPNLAAVRVVAGDYDQRDLDAVMNRAPLLGDIVQHWLA